MTQRQAAADDIIPQRMIMRIADYIADTLHDEGMERHLAGFVAERALDDLPAFAPAEKDGPLGEESVARSLNDRRCRPRSSRGNLKGATLRR